MSISTNHIKNTLDKITHRYSTLVNNDDTSIETIQAIEIDLANTLNLLKTLQDFEEESAPNELVILRSDTQSLIDDVHLKLDSGFFKGDKGDNFLYSDFTQEQLIALKVKGDIGESFLYSDFTQEQLNALKVKGDKGDAFSYDDFTNNQIDDLKVKGDQGISKDGFKNLIINGDFRVWQRGESIDVPINGYGSYTCDRWASYYEGSNVNKQQDLIDGKYVDFIEISRGVNNDDLFFYQKIENGSKLLSGKNLVLSFYAKSIDAFDLLVKLSFVNTGGLGSISQGGVNNISLTTSWKKFTFSLNQIDEFFGITREGFLHFIGSNMPIGSKLHLSSIQLEFGDVATDFEYRPLAIEEILCKRYFQKLNFFSSCMSSGVHALFPLPFQKMRVVPTVTHDLTINNGSLASVTCANDDILRVGQIHTILGTSITVDSGTIELDAEL